MLEGGNHQIVKYLMETSGVSFAGSCKPSLLQICGSQNLTLRHVTNKRLSLGIGRSFYREFHASVIHMVAMILDYAVVTLMAMNIFTKCFAIPLSVMAYYPS